MPHEHAPGGQAPVMQVDEIRITIRFFLRDRLQRSPALTGNLHIIKDDILYFAVAPSFEHNAEVPHPFGLEVSKRHILDRAIVGFFRLAGPISLPIIGCYAANGDTECRGDIFSSTIFHQDPVNEAAIADIQENAVMGIVLCCRRLGGPLEMATGDGYVLKTAKGLRPDLESAHSADHGRVLDGDIFDEDIRGSTLQGNGIVIGLDSTVLH